MAYIDKNDLLGSIKLEDLDQLTGGDDALIDTAILKAQAEVNDYISTRYDTVKEFANTGINRNYNLVEHMVNIALYKLYGRTNPKQIPFYRALQYDGDYVNTKTLGGALHFLTQVSKSELNVDIEEVTPYTSNRILSGGNKKYSSTF